MKTWGVCLVMTATLGLSEPSWSRPVPDESLGNERSQVIDRSPRDFDIDGGARRGGNLFHSFQEFGVDDGGSVYFLNPDSVNNIFSRVTGVNRSDILGTLGVRGAANLFLMNPNGILFGPNASLDIQGSFVGTTANAIGFGDLGFFDTANPGAPSSLLTVNPSAFLFNQAASQSGTIANTGNLTTGQDLTLSGNILDLQGQLVAGRNLTLEARDTLQIRDTVTTPFVAASRGQMLVQGDRVVDIFALNHPNSGLVSGGDMVLRSANQVGGDAHYWSGGNFRIEQLNGSLGDLYSPYDPIIRVVGDLELDNYRGASLHILAGGSVTIPGFVIIQGSDTTGAALIETVTLSDSTVLAIDGTTRPTVDIRAGVNLSALGTPLGVIGDGTVPITGTVTDDPASADISIGYINIASPSGLVYLTNQYQPNKTLANGNIAVNQTGMFGIVGDGLGTIRGIDTRSDTGNGGSVIIDSRNDIISPSQIRTASRLGNSGNITLLSAKDIVLTDQANINANVLGVGRAGDILIDADGHVSISGDGTGIRSNVDNPTSVGVGQGGTVTIRSGSLVLSDQTIIDVSTFGNGNAGKVFIDVGGAVTLESGSSIFNNIEENAIGNTGGIEIHARSLALSNGSQIIVSNVGGSGNLGNVSLDTTDSVSLRGIFNPLIRTTGTGIGNRLDSRSVGVGGNIIINTGSLLVSGANISASTFGTGNAGNVSIDARGSVSLAANSGISSTVDSGAVGNGGKIQINADSLSLNQSALQAIVRGASDQLPAGRGNSGNIIVNLRGDLEIVDNDAIPVGVGILTAIAEGVTEAATPGVTPVAGNISVSTRNLSLSGQNAQLRSTLDLYSSGQAGNINVEARSLRLSDRAEITTGTSGQGNAGNISIDIADSAVLATNANIYSGVSRGGNGNGGNISFEAGSLSVTGGAQFLSTLDRQVSNVDGETIANLPLAQGNAGDININVRGITTIDGGVGNSPNSTVPTGILSDAPSEIGGTGGNISIRSGSLVFRNGARLSSETNGIGQAGNISIDTRHLTLSNNAVVSSSTTSNSNAGDIEVNSEQLELSDDSIAGTVTTSNGNAGDIEVNVARLSLRNGSSLLADALTGSTGRAGNLTVNASESVDIVGTSAVDQDNSGVPDASGLYAQTRGAGDAGNLRVTTERLSIRDGGTISAGTSGSGHGGNLAVNASESIEILGSSPEQSFSSSINVGVENNASGDAGNATVNTDQLTLRNGGFIASSAESNSTGDAGGVAINANSIELVGTTLDGDNPTGISVSVEPGATGDVGDIAIATRHLNLRDGASILAQNLGSGQSGAVQISAADSIVIEGNGEATLINAVSGSDATGQPGNIRIQTQDLRLLNGGQIVAATLGRVNAGNIQVQADDLIEISGTSTDELLSSGISATSIPFVQGNAGQGGNIDVRARVLRLRGGEISASTFGQADAGNISVQASDSISLNSNSTISTTVNSGAIGNGGNITLDTDALNLDRSNITSSTSGQGNTGSIDIQATDRIALQDNSSISSTVNRGATGDSQRITLNTPALSLNGESHISAATNGNGRAGDVQIEADRVALSNSTISTEVRRNAIVPSGSNREAAFNSQLRSNTNPQSNIIINTRSLNLDNNAQITASTRGRGNAGNITVDADAIQIQNGSRLTTSTSSDRSAGNIRLQNLDDLTLDGNNSGIFANTRSNGRGGTIAIETIDLNLTNNAAVSSASQGSGRAGNIRIEANRNLDSRNGNITTSATQSAGGSIAITGGDINLSDTSRVGTDVGRGSEDGGNITINAEQMRLQENSDIQTKVSSGTGAGGDITINADSVLAFDDSDIISSAPNQGGDIILNTPVFFGSGYQSEASGNPDGNGRVDLDATGTVSSGNVQTPNTDFIQNSLSDLSETAIDADQLLANSCIARTESGGTFLITGSGGLPESPSHSTSSAYPTGEVRSIPVEAASQSHWQPGDAIVEPQGVYRLPDGRLIMGRECR